MRQRTLLLLFAVLIPAAFFGGWFAGRGGGGTAGSEERKVLYYVDPMNPSFRSPGPGTAPCGMALEPVYAYSPTPGISEATPPGAVAVRPDRLQLIGVAREPVHSSVVRNTLRLVGTVAPDETRLFRVTAATAGRIQEVGAATTGSLVKKGEILGAYYTGELLVPQQNFLRMYETYQTVQRGGTNPYDSMQGGGLLATYVRNVDVARQYLLNLGMSPEQIEELARSRQPTYLIQIRAPAAGLITSRKVSLGQTFEPRQDLFTIADLIRVWVLADAFEGQEEFFKAGARAIVTQPGTSRRFEATVSEVLPRFEPTTRTLKVRLEVVNPGLLLRPDMLVDVELPVEVGPALFVSKEAVLDSGSRRLVYVQQEEGVYVPRPVRTGRRVGGQVEILGGLMEDETVVTSGTFLLDSESRMRAAGAEDAGATFDPICGMGVVEAKARAQGLVSEYGGKTWFFCTAGCKRAFDSDPKTAAAKVQGIAEPMVEEREPAKAAGTKAFHMEDPVCGKDVDPDEAARSGLTSSFEGAPFFFCSPECKREFDKDPRAILSRPLSERSMPTAVPVQVPHEHGHDVMSPPMRQELPPSAPQSHQMPAGGHTDNHGPAPAGTVTIPQSLPQPQQQPGQMPAGNHAHTQGTAPTGTMTMQVDPVCRMPVDPMKARAGGLITEFNGLTWFLCTPECKREFDANPMAYLPVDR
jgi:membrane fusion protein, copper/silver efflux system